jgi:hypothetical protein
MTHGEGCTCVACRPITPKDIQWAMLRAQLGVSTSLGWGTITTDDVIAGPPLAEVMAQQVAELTKDFKGKTRVELPKAPATDSYADAYSSAVRNCDHPQDMIQDTLYEREWQCQQCGKFFDRTTRPKRNWFGW